jgi:two-component system response regulator FixJ
MASMTVHVIDDDEAMRQSLVFLLDSAGLTARAHDSAVSFLAATDIDPSGIVLTDVRMPDITGLELVRRMRALGMAQPVIVMTGHGDVSLAVEAMRSGACDFLEKPFEDEALLRSIHAAIEGPAASLETDREGQRLRAILATLSPRELEVLDGVIAGKLNKVIAFELGISPRTVEVYRANMMAKVGARGLSDLVRMVLLART